MLTEIVEYPPGPVGLGSKVIQVPCVIMYDRLDTVNEAGKSHVLAQVWIGNDDVRAVFTWDDRHLLPPGEDAAMALLGVGENGTLQLLGLTVNGHKVEVSPTS